MLHGNRQRLIKVLFLDGDCFGFVSKETEGQLYFLFGGRVIKFEFSIHIRRTKEILSSINNSYPWQRIFVFIYNHTFYMDIFQVRSYLVLLAS